jgi:bla regulator protein BlaR1
MSLPWADADLIATAWMLGKVSVLLAAAVITNALLHRRASAATRHLVWTLTVVGLLLLPMLSVVLPGWTVARLTAAAPLLTSRDAGVSALAVVSPAMSARSVGRAIGIPWSTALPALYAAGVLLLLARLIAEQVAMQRLARRATAISEPEMTHLLVEWARRMGVRRPVRVLRTREHSMPMVFGTRVPTIVLPAVAETWSQDRRRAVLLHELAHVARYDCLTQTAAAVACAVYWIHPGVWWVARRLRVERELACDDRVLTAGTHPREYAGHLLELAYSLGGHRAPALAVHMARSRQLEGRLLAVLDTARNRATPALRSRLAGLAIMAALLLPLAGAEATVVRAGADSPTLVQLAGANDEGLTILIQSIAFVGNQGISSGALKRQMPNNKEESTWRRLFGGRSRPYQAAKFGEDADQIVGYYRDHG